MEDDPDTAPNVLNPTALSEMCELPSAVLIAMIDDDPDAPRSTLMPCTW